MWYNWNNGKKGIQTQKILMIFLMLTPIYAVVASDIDFTNQMLDSEIERLTKQRDEKFAALQKCEETTKGFKIAGIATLAATGVGIYGNIKLSQKIKNETSSSSGGTKPSYYGTDEELEDSNCETICGTTDKIECEKCLRELT